MQNSNFAPSVINACILAGAEQEYEVSIDVSHEDGSNRVYTKDALASDGADAQAVCVTVLYKSRLPFLGAEMTNRHRRVYSILERRAIWMKRLAREENC